MIDTRRKLLTIALGECWHEFSHYQRNPFPFDGGYYTCSKCGASQETQKLRTFTTADDFFALWNASIKKEWWLSFIQWARTKKVDNGFRPDLIKTDYIDVVRFPELICDFGIAYLSWEEKK